LRSLEVYWRKILPGFIHRGNVSTQFDIEPEKLDLVYGNDIILPGTTILRRVQT